MDVKQLEAYQLLKNETLKGIQSEGSLFRHKKSGARVLCIENEDENKVFSIAFRTPPRDSTGTPHILEHSVLCGSRDFPAKDPFVELAKGSLNTFLNAMTYPDKTVYPVASCNGKDFQNLMHVYMDAVLYPNIYQHEEIFRQEGWSYHLEEPDGTLSYNGVVYNEMKGAFSSPEGVLDRVVLNTLFPDTCYAYESGGDPEEIPKLSYRQFLDFHKKYYHPSNSYIYLYGDMDMAEKLKWLDEAYLCKYEAEQIDSGIVFQKPFSRIVETTIPYSVSSEEPMEGNTYLSWSKVIGTSLEKELSLAFEVLDYALLSAPGAPLKKALTDAGIGKDIVGSYDNGIYQPIFSVIAKNADPWQKEEFLAVIEEVLSGLVKNGMDKKALEAGINYQEFRYREADYGSCPKGLVYGLEMLDSWLYDEMEPFMHVDALDTFAFLREQVDTGYYERLIQSYLLDNTHGAVVIVEPEQGRTARMDEALAGKLSRYKAGLSAEEVEELVANTARLEAYQSEPDRAEDLARIPTLERDDISRDILPIQNEELDLGGIPVVFHEIETNGIGYVDVMFDISSVEENRLPYVGILQSVLGIIDTEHYDYGTLSNEINRHTGGIGTTLELYCDVGRLSEKAMKATFEIRGKALYRKLPVMFSMMREILTASKLDDGKRIKEILDMLQSRLLMKFQSSGHTTALLRAQSYCAPSAKLKDLTDGVGFYRAVCGLTEHYEEKKEELFQELSSLAEQIFRADNMMVSYTASREGLAGIKAELPKLRDSLTQKKALPPACELHCEKKNEGFKTASKVQYVAKAGNFIDKGIAYTGALQILRVILNYDYLWQNIRVKGGAYGCMSGFNRFGEGYFVTYRDPNLVRTLKVFDGVVDYLKGFSVGERDMTKYIIGTMSNMDMPLSPSAKGERSMDLYMNKVSAEMIVKERNQILDATQEDIRALAAVAEAVLDAGQLCVVGGEEIIEENKELFGETAGFFAEGEGNGPEL